MHILRLIAPTLITAAALFVVEPTAAADTPQPVCVTAKLGSGLGAPRIDIEAVVDVRGPVAELVGVARFVQPVSPPAGLIIYAVSGAAIPNTDGVWVSLSGTGYDQAKTLYHGTIAVQLSTDPSKQTLSFTRQNLDGSGAATSTGVPQVATCSQL